MKISFFWSACCVALVASSATVVPAADRIDLADARIVVLGSSQVLSNAARMLQEEIADRTQIELQTVTDPVPERTPVILIATRKGLAGLEKTTPEGLEIPSREDGYALWTEEVSGNVVVNLIGHDERGALYAAGRLLRALSMEQGGLFLDKPMLLSTAPRYALRGHQVGYRPKTNSYDAWTIEMWEQYFRDMIIFGMNAVELVPPRTDDHYNSPHFPLPPMEMMIAMSGLADAYGLDVWIWYPALERDYSDRLNMEYALREREEVFRRLPRIDAVFVPAGDPGEVHPSQLFPLMEATKRILNRYHPGAAIWSSIQNYDDEPATMGWTEAFYEQLRTGKANWLDGVVFGPATETTLPEMRRAVPQRFPIRRYPDITHSRNCQYEVPGWDPAFQRTEGREVINPRPRAYTEIFRGLQDHAIGFITYSEGCNDDLNKVVWSSLGWDPETPVEAIVAEYARYFVGVDYQESFARGLFELEENWNGPLISNSSVLKTLEHFQILEDHAGPKEKLNWRFQQALYRAYYDAYIKARLEFETELEARAIARLKDAEQEGSLHALNEAQEILNQAAPYASRPEWRQRIFQLGEALYQSIRMQLSVPKYQAKEVGRGANLDLIDVPLNNSRRLREIFQGIRERKTETDRLEGIANILSGEYASVEYDWEEIVEDNLKEKNPLWNISRSADDMEHGPVVRSEFRPEDIRFPGLVGFRTSAADFDHPESPDTIRSLDQSRQSRTDPQAGYWTGYLEAPFTGRVTFEVETTGRVRMSLDEITVIDELRSFPRHEGSAILEKGKIYPVRLWYSQPAGPPMLRVYWSWEGRERTIVDSAMLFYGPENENHARSYLEE